jgi:hypothetical protein
VFDASNGPHFLSSSIEHRVGFPFDQLPKRYSVDKSGRRVLVGLSIEETFEFETLDDLAPLDDSGGHIPWRDGVPITSREKRWLELYQKHDAAWRVKTLCAQEMTPDSLRPRDLCRDE